MEPLLTTSPRSREMEIIKIKNKKEFKEARKELEMDLSKGVSLTDLLRKVCSGYFEEIQNVGL